MRRLRIKYWVSAAGYWFVDSEVWIPHDSFMQFETIEDSREFKTKKRAMKEVLRLLRLGSNSVTIDCLGVKQGKRYVLKSKEIRS